MNIRCSELSRVLSCSGSMTLVPRVSPRKGEEGLEGSALHFLAHQKLKDTMGAVGDIGQTPEIPKSVRFSSWIADYYVGVIRDIVPPDWSLECEVTMAHDFPQFTLTGHADDVAISPDATEAILFDLKTGYDPQDAADENDQLLGYAVLLLQAYPALRKITAYLVQPRNDEDEGHQRVSSVVIEGDVLASATASLEARVNAALAAPMLLNSGKKQCRWCPCGIQCPALQKELQLMEHTLTPEEIARVGKEPNDAQLGDWIISARTLRQPTEDAEALIKERILAAGFVDAGVGTRITMKIQGGSYSFPDKLAFYRLLLEDFPDAEMLAKILKFSVSETRDLLAERYGCPKTGKAAVTGTSLFDARYRPLVEQGERKLLQFT
jgi:hypothetical protein